MRRTAPFMALLALLVAACERETPKPLSVKGEQLYMLKGKILSRDRGDNTLKIDHEAIAGFMEAMTMDYSVRGADVATLPPSGTVVTAKLHVISSAYWLTDVQKAAK